MKFKIVSALIAASALVSCRPINSGSTVKHEFGQTSVKPTGAFLNCTDLEEAETASKILPKAQKYINGIARHIIEANGQTFRGHFSFDKFCIGVIDDPEYNAYALPFHRAVTFHSEAILQARTDAEIGAVMAHELAHVTMQHSSPLTFADLQRSPRVQENPEHREFETTMRRDVDPLMRRGFEAATQLTAALNALAGGDAAAKSAIERIFAIEDLLAQNEHMTERAPSQWQRLNDQLIDAYDDLGGLLDGENGVAAAHYKRQVVAAEKESAAIMAKMQGLQEAIQQQAKGFVADEQIYNGTEREADEVGYEFYLRAGLKKESFLNVEGDLARLTNETYLGSRAAFYECLIRMWAAGRKSVERGQGSHPTGCWRLYNIAVTESSKHSKDYAKLLPGATRTTIMRSPSLSEVKAEIRAFRANDARPAASVPQPGVAAREKACESLGGTWHSDMKYCDIPLKPTQAEGERFCKTIPDTFYHGPKCFCLPIDWKKEEIVEDGCYPKSQEISSNDDKWFDGDISGDDDDDRWNDDDNYDYENSDQSGTFDDGTIFGGEDDESAADIVGGSDETSKDPSNQTSDSSDWFW